jgi:predicted transposase YbfD/YdcC
VAWDGPPPDLATARTIDKGHGRIEQRELAATSEIVPYLDWPGAAQVCRIRRTRELAGKRSQETVYAITSLTRERASCEDLLELNRQHWSIENRLHWIRDTAFAEDASRVRSKNAPQALAALRNTALRLLAPFKTPTRATRHAFAEDRLSAINLAVQGFL